MKDLSTVVPDIYSSLEQLSAGVPLDINEEELEHTVGRIREALVSWATPRESKDFTIRMSNIGKPSRQLWYESRDDKRSSDIDGATQIKFLYGHLLEEIVLMLVRVAGHEVTDEQKEVSVEGVLGHMDCKINGEVVDVKTASRFAFNKFRDNRLHLDDPFGYLGQLSGYEEAEGTNSGGFLVLNKESGELCMHIPEQENKIIASDKIKSIKDELGIDTAPALCYNPIPDGQKGNMILPKGCSWCKYKYKCHVDSNDGAGLRTFKYSNGLKYFTEVKSEPKVEELL
tara:strand:- start:6787 stop:7641 length:855 start_codon:yes stop_codon:yes gene_type:complete